MGWTFLQNIINKVLSTRILDSNAALSKDPAAHGLEFLEREKWNPDLMIGCFHRIPPCFKVVLWELVEVIFLHSSNVKDGLESILIDSSLCVSIEANPLERGTESIPRVGSHGQVLESSSKRTTRER